MRSILVHDSSVKIARVPSTVYCRIETFAAEVEADVSRRGFAGATVIGLPHIGLKVRILRVPGDA